jgi:anti-sigma regulatory factor (Ser/Thr protein kinase)
MTATHNLVLLSGDAYVRSRQLLPSQIRFHTSGPGIYLMKTLVDEVQIEQRGPVVQVRKTFAALADEEGETK